MNLLCCEGSTGGVWVPEVPEVYSIKVLERQRPQQVFQCLAKQQRRFPQASLGLVSALLSGILASIAQYLSIKLLSYLVNIELLYVELTALKDISAEWQRHFLSHPGG